MKDIVFENCNGTKRIVSTDSGAEVEIMPGMAVVLLLRDTKHEIHVEIRSVEKNGKIFIGKVLEIGQKASDESGLKIGDEVRFVLENIAYPLDQNKSIT